MVSVSDTRTTIFQTPKMAKIALSGDSKRFRTTWIDLHCPLFVSKNWNSPFAVLRRCFATNQSSNNAIKGASDIDMLTLFNEMFNVDVSSKSALFRFYSVIYILLNI